jgi:predicted enzyme related to lactoylglutathione lyase
MRTRGDGSTAFDDSVGEVSGAFTQRRAPYGGEPGLLVYVMVDSVEQTLDKVVKNGGAVVQPIGKDAPEITARFRDPGGNVLGLYQQRGSV